MNPLAVFPLIICISLENLEQLSYGFASKAPARRLVYNSLGVGIHVILFGVWFWLLTLLPLGIAMPLLGANYATVALGSHFLFKEKVSLWRWFGIVMIVAGLAMICAD